MLAGKTTLLECPLSDLATGCFGPVHDGDPTGYSRPGPVIQTNEPSSTFTGKRILADAVSDLHPQRTDCTDLCATGNTI
ncbi:hypothetical protein D3C86_1871340 [compost metagenome]